MAPSVHYSRPSTSSGSVTKCNKSHRQLLTYLTLTRTINDEHFETVHQCVSDTHTTKIQDARHFGECVNFRHLVAVSRFARLHPPNEKRQWTNQRASWRPIRERAAAILDFVETARSFPTLERSSSFQSTETREGVNWAHHSVFLLVAFCFCWKIFSLNECFSRFFQWMDSPHHISPRTNLLRVWTRWRSVGGEHFFNIGIGQLSSTISSKQLLIVEYYA